MPRDGRGRGEGEDGATAREIRAAVLEELESRDPQWADSWKFYDHVVKGRITYEGGKFVVIGEIRLCPGREVRGSTPPRRWRGC